MVVARRRVGHQGSERVERRLVTGRQLTVHVLLDLVHRHMAGTLDHHLHVMLPGQLRQLAQGRQLTKLRLVVGVRDASGPQAVSQAEGDVVLLHDGADLFEVGVEEVLLMVGQAPLGHDRAPARDDAGQPPRRERHVAQQHPGVDGEVVDALLGLLDQGAQEDVDR